MAFILPDIKIWQTHHHLEADVLHFD